MKNDEYRFRITQGRFGFWWWHVTGHGIWNVSYASSHLPRRSRAAAEVKAAEWADRKRNGPRSIEFTA